jgi:hypothetical protein
MRSEITHRLLNVRRVLLLVDLWHQVGIRVWINHVLRHLSRMHREHWLSHRSSLESDMGSSIRRGTILEGGLFEDHALAVAFAVTLGFDAVLAHGTFLAALDATFATCQASCLGPLA